MTYLRTAWRSYTTSLATAFTYRSTMLFWMLWRVALFLTAVAVWSAIFAERGPGTIGGYTLDGMVTYYLLAQIVFTVTMSFAEFQIIEDIRSGSLALTLTRPWGYAEDRVVGTVAWNGLQLLLGIVVFTLLSQLTGVQFGAELHIAQLPAFVVSLILGLAFGAVLSILMGAMAFWILEPSALVGLKLVTFQFLSGVIVPLTIFPEWAQPLLLHSPFPVVSATPVRLLTVPMDLPTVLGTLAEQLAWTVLLSLVTWRVWRAGVRRFESAGG